MPPPSGGDVVGARGYELRAATEGFRTPNQKGLRAPPRSEPPDYRHEQSERRRGGEEWMADLLRPYPAAALGGGEKHSISPRRIRDHRRLRRRL